MSLHVLAYNLKHVIAILGAQPLMANANKKPSIRDTATINPQSAIVTGLASTALTDVRTATATPAFRCN